MESHQITGAATPLTLIDKDGKEFTYSATALSDRGFDELSSWIQSQVTIVARRSLRLEAEEAEEAGVPVEFDYDQEMQIATKAAMNVTLYDEAKARILNTPSGASRIAWLLCKGQHEKLEHKDLIPLFRIGENRNEVFRVLAKLNPQNADASDKLEVTEEAKN